MSLWRGGNRNTGVYPDVVWSFTGYQGDQRVEHVVAQEGDYIMDSLGDADTAAATAGMVMYWNTITGNWEARALNDPPPGTPPGQVPPHALNDHTDVNAATPQADQFLRWDDGAAEWIASDFNLSAVTYQGTWDVTTPPPAGPANGDAYIHNGPSGVADAGWTGIAGEGVEPGNVVVFDGVNWSNVGLLGQGGVTSVVGDIGLDVDDTTPNAPVVFMRADWWEGTERNHMLDQHTNLDSTNKEQNSIIRWDAANARFDYQRLLNTDAPGDGEFYGRRDTDGDSLNEWSRNRMEYDENVMLLGLPDLPTNPNAKWLAFDGVGWEVSELDLPNTIDFMGVIDAVNNPPPAAPTSNWAYINAPNDGTIDPGWALGVQGIQPGDPVLSGDLLVFSQNTGFWYNAGTGANNVTSVTGSMGLRAVGAPQDPVIKMARTVDGDAVEWFDEVAHTIDQHTNVNIDTATVALDHVLVFDGTNWVNQAKVDGFSHSMNFHTDVDTLTSVPIAGDGLYWDGANWVPQSAAGVNPNLVPHNLGAHTDVDLTTTPPGAGNVLSYDGANWVPGAAGGAGEVNTSSNAGAGEGLALPKVGADLPFKTITAGPNITLVSSASELNIDATVPAPTVQLGADNGLATAPLNLSVVATLPGVPDPNTIYFVTTI